MAEAVASLKRETSTLKETQVKHEGLLEAVLQQVINLASSYDNVMQNISRNQNNGETSGNNNHHYEETSGKNSRNNNPFTDGGVRIHARSIKLVFPKFDRIGLTNWVLKAQ